MDNHEYNKIKDTTLYNIELLRGLDQTKVLEEGIKILNFSHVCRITQWLEPTIVFLKSLGKDFCLLNNVTLKQLRFNSPEQLYMVLFLHTYFKPNRNTLKKDLRIVLFAALTMKSNTLHKISLLFDLEKFSDKMAIYQTGYRFIRSVFPDFFWDPDFVEIISSRDINAFLPDGGLDIKKFSKEIKELVFSILDKGSYTSERLFFPIFDLTNEFLSGLKASKSEILSYFKRFSEYLNLRVPSQYEELQNKIIFFELILELSDYQPFMKINYAELKRKLSERISTEDADKLIENFIYEKQGAEFDPDHPDFFRNIYEEYLRFISCAGFYHLGSIYTGFFFIWHSFFGIVDQIQTDSKFRTRKGQLLENYVYTKLQEKGIESYKLILRNTKVIPDKMYKNMKDQVQIFPSKSIIEKDIAFPPGVNGSFREFDLIMKINKKLLVIEIKGTHVQPDRLDFVKWAEFHKRQHKTLSNKEQLLRDIWPSLKDNHAVFEEIEEFESILLKTEGLIFENEESVLAFLEKNFFDYE